MANVLNRITKEYLVSVNTPDFPVSNWIINPDLSSVVGFPTQYWTITGDTITLQSQAERDVTDDNTFIATLATSVGNPGFFGDGPDGDMIIAVDTALTQDIYPGRLTINAGVNLDTAGFRIIAKTGVDIYGTVRNNGSDAVGSVNGNGGISNTLGGGTAGATGTNAAGASSATLNLDATPGQGGRGGQGGSGSSGSGGSGGQIRNQNNSRVRARRFDNISMMADSDFGAAGDVVRFHGGTGGGAGAGGGGASLGGGGGGGGANVLIIAPYIFISPTGTIQARGGIGGTAASGNAGGGGGGGGGVINTIANQFRQRGQRDVTAGIGGTGSGTGAAGSAGNDGRAIHMNIAA